MHCWNIALRQHGDCTLSCSDSLHMHATRNTACEGMTSAGIIAGWEQHCSCFHAIYGTSLPHYPIASNTAPLPALAPFHILAAMPYRLRPLTVHSHVTGFYEP